MGKRVSYTKIDQSFIDSMTVRDVNGFSSEDDEWVQNLIHIMEKVLGMKQRVTYTYDFDLFKRYGNPTFKVGRGDWGGCSPDEGFVWINARKHKTSAKQELANTIIHELLHIKHPNWKEKRIVSEANKYVHTTEEN